MSRAVAGVLATFALWLVAVATPALAARDGRALQIVQAEAVRAGW